MPKTIILDIAKLDEMLADCRVAHVTYGLGAKVPFLDARPGHDFTRIDCSGFVRWLIYHATGKTLKIPDGSANQGEWFGDQGFAKAAVSDGKLKDGRVRVAILSPANGGGVGHIALIRNGKTWESHGGGVGPDSRAWTGAGWQSKCYLFTLTEPITAAKPPAPAPAEPLGPVVEWTQGGQTVTIDGIIHNDHVYVSAERIAKAQGMVTTWDGKAKRMTAKK